MVMEDGLNSAEPKLSNPLLKPEFGTDSRYKEKSKDDDDRYKEVKFKITKSLQESSHGYDP